MATHLYAFLPSFTRFTHNGNERVTLPPFLIAAPSPEHASQQATAIIRAAGGADLQDVQANPLYRAWPAEEPAPAPHDWTVEEILAREG